MKHITIKKTFLTILIFLLPFAATKWVYAENIKPKSAFKVSSLDISKTESKKLTKKASIKKKSIKKKSTKKKSAKNGSYKSFTASRSFPSTYKVYENTALLAKATARNTKIKIDISEQRIKLLVNNKVAIDSPATTGSRRKKDRNTGEVKDKRTPKGTFKIQEKIRDKRSTIFGKLYYKGKVVYGGDRRKYKGKYDKYIGASLPYWMRITGDGIGLHLSRGVKRKPASNGCIRIPPKVVNKIYKKVKVGTRVEVVS